MEDVKGGMTMQMALKSQLKLDEDAARPPLQTVPVLLAEQVSLSQPCREGLLKWQFR